MKTISKMNNIFTLRLPLWLLLLFAILLSGKMKGQNTNLPVGVIPGNAGVSALGAATYTIPIEVIPGTAGVQPNLNVMFSSVTGFGALGTQCDLGGISVISRVGKNQFLDHSSSAVSLDYKDRFSLDGNRLVCMDPTQYGLDGTTYYPEFEDYSYVVSYSGYGNGPDFFKVYSDNGTIAEYGKHENSKQIIGNIVLNWYVNKITDRNGNYMTYTYGHSGNEIWIEHIDYTGNSNAGLSPYARVSFVYDTTSHIGSRFVYGYEIRQTRLLSSIRVEYYNGGAYELVRRYDFTYSYESPKKLENIHLTASDDQTMLNPVSLQWETQGVGVPDTTHIYTSAFHNGSKHLSIDFNKDGLVDIVEYDADHCVFFQNTGNTFQYVHVETADVSNEWQILLCVAADVDGDGYSELLIVYQKPTASKIHVFEVSYNGSSFHTEEFSSEIQASAVHKDNVFAGDFFGNDRHQMLLHFDTRVMLLGDYKGSFRTIYINTLQNSLVEILDFDGDRQMEFMVLNRDVNIFKCDPDNNTINRIRRLNHLPDKFIGTGDFNGDGISDLLLRTIDNPDPGLSYWVSFGTGHDFTSAVAHDTYLYHTAGDKTPPRVADINGDGYDDIMTFILSNAGLKVQYHLGRGYYNDTLHFLRCNHIPHPCLVTSSEMTGGDYDILIGDFDNNHHLDILVFKDIGTSIPGVMLYDFNAEKQPPQMVQLNKGDGSFTRWHFREIRGMIYRYASFISQIPLFFNVVDTLTSSGETPVDLHRTCYDFAVPYYTPRRRQVLGFGSTVVRDMTHHTTDSMTMTNVKAENNVWQDVLLPVSRKKYVGNRLLQTTEYGAECHLLPLNRRILITPLSVTTNHLEGTVSTVRNTYYVSGRLRSSTSEVRDVAAAEPLTLDSVRYAYLSITIPNGISITLPDSSETISRMAGSPRQIVGTKRYTYNYLGQPVTCNTMSDGQTVIKQFGGYNAYGLATEETLSADSCQSRMTSLSFDPTGRFVVQATNPLNHSTSSVYDPKTGLVLAKTDANGLTTTYSYDSWGRMDTVRYPDGTMTTYACRWYTQSSIPKALYYTVAQTTGSAREYHYYDLLGRNIRTRKIDSYTDTRYNTKGLVDSVSAPHAVGVADVDKLWHTYQYDSLGRLTSEHGPYTDLSYSYSARTVSITDNLRQTTTVKTSDAAGRPLLASDPGGTILYQYALDTCSGHTVLRTDVTTVGNTTSAWTDQQGNRLKLDDPDAGVLTYQYNTYGELVRQTDARGFSTLFTYDKLGRATQKTYTDTTGTLRTVNFTYDQFSSNNRGRGKPSTIQINDTLAEQYVYDQLGRLKQTTRYVDGTAHTEICTYNAFGQLDTFAYPDGFAVKYGYEESGRLNAITLCGSEVQLVKVPRYNLYGHATRIEYGNGLATDWEYDSRGILTRINTGNIIDYEVIPDTLPGPPDPPIDPPVIGPLSIHPLYMSGMDDVYSIDSTVQNFRYTYDGIGRLVQRTGRYGQYENFQYDNLDRLTSFTQGSANGISQTFSTVYNTQGNITGSTLAGSYQYDSEKPHAVTSVMPSTNFPEAISSSQCETEYNFLSQPSRIAEENVEILLEYGADNQRAKTVFKNSGHIARTRYHISANYERETDLRGVEWNYHYIYGPNGLAALCVRRDGVDSLYYVHPDRLGSYTHITNAGKQVVRALHFDPWGNVKADTNWTVFATNAPSTLIRSFRFDRGFTGHEHYADLKVINMNGRLYDPVIARFFSPDNFVQLPDFTQSYNRYSYCLNNPLQYVDPSGEKLKWWQNLLIGLGLDFLTGGAVSTAASLLGTSVAFSSTSIGYEMQKLVSPVAFKFSYGFGSRNHIGFDASFGPGGILDYRWHGGVSYYFGDNAYGKYNGWEFRDGAEIRWYGVASISGTRFSAGEYSQITNKITIGNARKNISYENDQLFGIGKVLGIYNADGGDRWRSAAVQFRYGLFNATLNLFTGDPGLVERDRSITNYFHEYYSSEGALDANQRAGVLSFGFGSFRLGRNSEIIRHIFQNELAHSAIMKDGPAWFKFLDIEPTWFWYFGSFNGNTLW
jgi:RHS repeat-associated protein